MQSLSRKKDAKTDRGYVVTVKKAKKTEQEVAPKFDTKAAIVERDIFAEAQMREQLLTERQKETLKLLAQGMSNKQIAQELNISVKTVDAHRAGIMTRLRIHNLAGLVKYAIRTGLTTVE